MSRASSETFPLEHFPTVEQSLDASNPPSPWWWLIGCQFGKIISFRARPAPGWQPFWRQGQTRRSSLFLPPESRLSRASLSLYLLPRPILAEAAKNFRHAWKGGTVTPTRGWGTEQSCTAAESIFTREKTSRFDWSLTSWHKIYRRWWYLCQRHFDLPGPPCEWRCERCAQFGVKQIFRQPFISEKGGRRATNPPHDRNHKGEDKKEFRAKRRSAGRCKWIEAAFRDGFGMLMRYVCVCVCWSWANDRSRGRGGLWCAPFSARVGCCDRLLGGLRCTVNGLTDDRAVKM